jgi:tetratricopeptide (TPR) repeat protein
MLFFDNAHCADPTEQEFLELVLRRARPEKLHIAVGTTDDTLPEGLAGALHRYARRIDIASAPASDVARAEAELVRAFVSSDGTSDDPQERAAYERSPAAIRAPAHDERADELTASDEWALRLGAIPYHREHGTDPRRAGCRALLAALEYCLAMGFYPALYDLGERGRAIVDQETQQLEYCQFSAKAAGALVALGRPADAERMYLAMRERYALPRVHMSTSYNLAMLYTRWYRPEHKDHNLAKVFCNNAIALAMLEPDPELRSFCTVFQRNGLALVEMHRGNPERALTLVTEGIGQLDRELPADKYLVHRSQLVHNRARVLNVLGRLDECQREFTKLLAIDPHHAEYYVDRGNVARQQGDDETALADYERARVLSPPFPEIYYNLGDLRATRGDLTSAIADFAYLLEMEPDHLDARISHIELLIETGNLAAASAELADALDRHQGSAALLALAGLVALNNGDRRQARAHFDASISLDHEFAAARVHRARLAADSGENELAIADLTRARATLGDDPDLLYQRALCHLAIDDRAEARTDLEALIALGESALSEDARGLLSETGVRG